MEIKIASLFVREAGRLGSHRQRFLLGMILSLPEPQGLGHRAQGQKKEFTAEIAESAEKKQNKKFSVNSASSVREKTYLSRRPQGSRSKDL